MLCKSPESEHIKMELVIIRLGRGKTIALCMGWTAQVTTRDQQGLADSSINYTAVAYKTCGARMCYQHSALRVSHSCECTALQHDGMAGRDTCALSSRCGP